MENNYLEEFVTNPFSQRYLRYCESTLCSNVTTLSALCSEINSLKKKKSPEEVAELLDSIDYICRNFMRLSDCHALLLRMADENSEVTVGLECFLESFAGNCNKVIGKVCPVNVSGDRNVMARFNMNIVRRSMLEFIRNYGLKYGRGTEFDISCGETDGSAFIALEIGKFGKTGEFSEMYDMNIFSEYCNEINKMFSEKSGTEYVFSENAMRIKVPADSDGAEPVMTDNSAIISRVEFSEYNTMLSDLL